MFLASLWASSYGEKLIKLSVLAQRKVCKIGGAVRKVSCQHSA